MDDRPLPCFFCGYDLRDAGEARCSECGRSFLDALVALDAVARRRGRWAIGFASVGAALVLALLVFVLASLIG